MVCLAPHLENNRGSVNVCSPLPNKENIMMAMMISTNVECILCARCWVRVFRIREGKHYYTHFVDKKIKAQRGQKNCQMSQSQATDRTRSPPSNSRLLPHLQEISDNYSYVLAWGTQHSLFSACPYPMLEEPYPAGWLLTSF